MYSELVNIRQSPQYCDYMKSLKWDIYITQKGVKIFLRKFPLNLLNLAKIQKPVVMDDNDIKEVDEICKKHLVKFVMVDPMVGQDMELFKKIGFIKSKNPLSPSATSYIDLTLSEEQLYKNLTRSGRYGLNRSLREKCYVQVYDNPSDKMLADFYKIHARTAKRNKFMTKPLNDLIKRRDSFKNNFHLSFVYDGSGVLCGGKVFQGYNEMALFTYGGTSDTGRTNRSGYLLLWESIRFLKKKGYKILDLEGMYDDRFPKEYEGWKGFSEFKMKFGPEIVEFPEPVIKIYSPLFRIANKLLPLNL